jgi:hypothetical protein
MWAEPADNLLAFRRQRTGAILHSMLPKKNANVFLGFGRYSDFLNFEAENSLMVRMRATTISEKTATPVKKRMSSVI